MNDSNEAAPTPPYPLIRTSLWVLVIWLCGSAQVNALTYWPKPGEGQITPQPLVEQFAPAKGFNNPVTDAAINHNTGDIWVTTYHDFIYRLRNDQWIKIPVRPGVQLQSLSFAPDAETLWVGGLRELGKLNSLDPEAGYLSVVSDFESASGLSDWFVWKIVATPDGCLASIDSSLWEYSNGKFTQLVNAQEGIVQIGVLDGQLAWTDELNRVVVKDGNTYVSHIPKVIKSSELTDIFPDYPDHGSIAKLNEWYCKTGSDFFSVQMPKDSEIPRSVESEFVDRGIYALATFNDGIHIRDLGDETLYHLSQDPNSGSSYSIYSLDKDHDGNLWIGSEKGLAVWRSPGLTWRWLPLKNLVTAVHRLPDRLIFSSINKDYQWDGEQFRNVSDNNDDFTYELAAFGTEHQWKAIRGSLWHAVKGKDSQQTTLDDEIFKLQSLDPEGNSILVSARQQHYLANVRDDGEIEISPALRSAGRASWIERYHDNIWIAFANGKLQRLDVKHETSQLSITASRIWQAPSIQSSDFKAALWGDYVFHYSSQGAQLFEPESGTFRKIAGLDPLAIEMHHVLADGSLVLAAKIRKEIGGQERRVLINLGKKPSPSPEIRTFWIPGRASLSEIIALAYDAENHIWFLGGYHGLISCHESLLRSFDEFPQIHLESSIDEIETKEIPYNAATISFDWNFTNWMDNPPFEIEYRISELRSEWQSQSTNQLELTLREDNYTLETRIKDPIGNVRVAPSISFTVLPPWYRSRWAYAGYLCLLAIGIYAVFRIYSFRERIRRDYLERMVAQRTRELETANAAKSEFVANMSHELRNPMNGVVGLAELLSRTTLSGDQHQIVQTIQTCAEQLSQMIGDVLDFAKIEVGRVKLEKRPFSTRTMLEKALSIVSWDATQSNHEIELEIAGNVPPLVHGDDRKISQIVINYLSNACKYSDPGVIRLRAEHEAILRNRVRVRISVIDSGPGLSTEEQAHIFERFYRSPRAANSPVRGSGLGLSVCAELAELMGASYGVSRNESGGSTFYFEVALPLPEGMDAHAQALDFDQDYIGSVLVVDDMDYNRLVGAGILESLGFTVTAVATGKEAVACLLSADYDFAFLDFDLPDLDGPEIVREVKKERPKMRTRCFAVTAYVSDIKRKACVEAGMNGFVSKPISRAKIREALLASGLDESTLVSGPAKPKGSSQLEEQFDLEPLLMLSRGNPDKLLEKCDDYIKVLDEEMRVLREMVNSDESDPGQIGKRLHRLLSHGSILKAELFVGAVNHMRSVVKGRPRENWMGAFENLDEAAREVGINLRRIVGEYHSRE